MRVLKITLVDGTEKTFCVPDGIEPRSFVRMVASGGGLWLSPNEFLAWHVVKTVVLAVAA